MSFIQILKDKKQDSILIEESHVKRIIEKQNSKKPEDILRGSGYKIKLVTPTSFGTQIDFAKKYEDKDVEKVLKDFKIKIKNKSVFIVN